MFQNWEFLIAEIWLHLLVAIALTLFLSWALWGMRAWGERTELAALQDDLQKAQRTLSAKESDLEQALEKQEQLKDRMSGFQSKLTEALAARKSVEKAAAADRADLDNAIKSRDAARIELSQTSEKLAALTKDHAALKLVANAAPSDTKSKLAILRERISQDAKAASAWTKNSVMSLLDKAK